MSDKVEISGVHLSTVGEHVIVAVEIQGKWIEVIRERKDNAYSHIVEGPGITTAASHQGIRLERDEPDARALRGEMGTRS